MIHPEDDSEDDKADDSTTSIPSPQKPFQNSTTDLFKKYNNFGFNQFKNRDK